MGGCGLRGENIEKHCEIDKRGSCLQYIGGEFSQTAGKLVNTTTNNMTKVNEQTRFSYISCLIFIHLSTALFMSHEMSFSLVRILGKTSRISKEIFTFLRKLDDLVLYILYLKGGC